MKYKLSVDDVKECIEQGLSQHATGVALGVSKARLENFSADHGLYFNSTSRLSEEVSDRVLRLYKETNSVGAVAKTLKLATTTVKRSLVSQGVVFNHKNNKPLDLTEDLKAEVISNYAAGVSIVKIANRLGVGKAAIASFLRKSGVTASPNKVSEEYGVQHKNSKYFYNKEFIVFLIEKGYSLGHISQIIDIPYSSVKLYLNNNNIPFNKQEHRLTPFQFKQIMDRYDSGMTAEEAVSGFELSGAELLHHRRKLGLPVIRRLKTLQDYMEDEVVSNSMAMYVEGYKAKDIVEETGISYGVMRKVAELSGVRRTRQDSADIGNATPANTEAFSDFSKEFDAYFYGFLLADGYIAPSRNLVSIIVKDTDVDILEKFLLFLNSSTPIRREVVLDKRTNKEYKRCVANIRSWRVVERLLAQGMEQCKSMKEKLPNFDWKTNRHFWRGMVDGDGHLSPRNNSIVLVGSKEVVSGFLEFAENHIEFKTKRSVVRSSNKQESLLYRVTITGQDAVNLINLLYKDSTIYLDRKYKVAVDRYIK